MIAPSETQKQHFRESELHNEYSDFYRYLKQHVRCREDRYQNVTDKIPHTSYHDIKITNFQLLKYNR